MSEGTKIVCMHIPVSLHAFLSSVSIENGISRTKILVKLLKHLKEDKEMLHALVQSEKY